MSGSTAEHALWVGCSFLSWMICFVDVLESAKSGMATQGHSLLYLFVLLTARTSRNSTQVSLTFTVLGMFFVLVF